MQSAVIFLFRCPNCRKSTADDDVVKFNFWQFSGGKASGKKPPPTRIVAVRIRARGTIAGGRYLAVHGVGGVLKATATALNASGTQFDLVDNEDGSWGIKAAGGRLLCANATTGEVAAAPYLPGYHGYHDHTLATKAAEETAVAVAATEARSASACARFRLQPTVDGSFGVQSYATQGWLVVAGRAGYSSTDARGSSRDAGTVTATAADPRAVPDDASRFDFEV